MPSDTKQSQARQLLEQLRQQYLQELPGKISEIEGLLLGYDPQDGDRDDFDRLYRQVHSLMGSAGTHGMHIISTVCHKLEDFLEQSTVRDRTTFLDQALPFIDLLREAGEQIEQGRDNFPAIEAALADLTETRQETRFNILLVTPSRSTQALCLGILEQLPVRVSVVDDGISALSRLRHEKFDILITAMTNRSLNGLSLTAATRLSEGVNGDIRVILLSSDMEPSSPFRRRTDPDVVIRRNAVFATNLYEAVRDLLRQPAARD